MRIKAILVPVVLTVLTLSASHICAGDEVYRWVDEDGVVHFGDKAEGHPQAERVEIDPADDHGLGVPPTATSPAAISQPPQPYDTESSAAQQKRDERAERRKLDAEMKQQVAAVCQQARLVVAKLEPSPNVLVENEDGSVSRMDDNRRLELLAEAKAYIAENCTK